MDEKEYKRKLRWFVVTFFYCCVLSVACFFAVVGLWSGMSGGVQIGTKIALTIIFGLAALGLLWGAIASGTAASKMREEGQHGRDTKDGAA